MLRRAGLVRARVLVLLALAVLVLALGVYDRIGPTGRSAIVRIPRGAGASAVGELLAQAGVVRDARAFAWLARVSGRASALPSGVFLLEGDGTIAVLEQLVSPELRPVMIRVTFVEGWRAVDQAAALRAKGFDGDGFLTLVRFPPPGLKPAYDRAVGLEGYLFPDTYDFPADASPEQLVRAMLSRFERELTGARREKLAAMGLDVHAWVTLASLVQAEAGNASEMPWIAGVFLNRLARGMPLQSDPTVAYALGKRLPELDRSAGDFDVDSPYNTYRHPGLPPGPINNPGEAALSAVLSPKRTSPRGRPYLYFFHARGKLYLNETFQGHLRDLNRYRYGR